MSEGDNHNKKNAFVLTRYDNFESLFLTPEAWPSEEHMNQVTAWISNYIHYQMWDEIMYPFTNFNSCYINVGEWG